MKRPMVGAGRNRGRRHLSEISPGDAVDFFRVMNKKGPEPLMRKWDREKRRVKDSPLLNTQEDKAKDDE